MTFSEIVKRLVDVIVGKVFVHYVRISKNYRKNKENFHFCSGFVPYVRELLLRSQTKHRLGVE